jgi:hypothetical protein
MSGYNHLTPCLHVACRVFCRKHESSSCTFADTFSHINPLVDATGTDKGDGILDDPADKVVLLFMSTVLVAHHCPKS